mgnify:CR=1 FL=1
MNRVLKLAGNVNEAMDLNLKKYAWQFGIADFQSAIDKVFKQAKMANYRKIAIPCLFIMGQREGAELQRQTMEIYEVLKTGFPYTKLQIFEAKSDTDAHCQVNNFRLVHNMVFDWLAPVRSSPRR